MENKIKVVGRGGKWLLVVGRKITDTVVTTEKSIDRFRPEFVETIGPFGVYAILDPRN